MYSMHTVTVLELIEYLKQFPMSMPIAFRIHSECSLLQLEEIQIEKMQPARTDGWIHTYPRNKEAETVDYLVFPGN